MPTVNATAKIAKDGVNIITSQATKILVQAPAIEILIGGPYISEGEEHTYGHVALRVVTASDEHVYDFGRYAGERGPFGQGRLRVWTDFSKYIASENATGRTTTGFLYRVTSEAAKQVNAHFDGLIGDRPVLRAYANYRKEYRLAVDYHALTNNCTTTSMGGARIAIKDLDYNVSKYNQGRGMSTTEQYAAKIAGWPTAIFMPTDLKQMLEENPAHRPDKVEKFGGSK
ncbi:hypothetical protein [Massilia sp.]|uniref:hypothetical protein n=1 Tax=Massilia sp. TaxID=1882437 RepID=UPI00352F29C9